MFSLTPYVRRRGDISLFDPFREFGELQRRFFDEPSFGAFKIDVKDNGGEYLLEADLPGFKKEDISIDVSGDRLVISAERHSEYEENDKKGNYIKCERSYGSFSRSFDLTGIRQDGIRAAYNDGVLTLTLPKSEAEAPQSRRLEIE
ncbi:MAG: Hsp20/alpha crystallin family protein [Clostridia bacterium]|nr:Hsp20/alpha crystallin family protein [Clostridia bacterium]